MKYTFAIMLLLYSISCFNQNYHRYYELTDSAYYYWKTSDTLKADSMYAKAFDHFVGFPDDYADAAYNIWHKNAGKGRQYIAKAFQYGGSLKDIEYYLSKNGIQISKRELKSIARQNKEQIKSRKKRREIRRMFRKDQMARIIFNKRKSKVDSINRAKFIDYVNNDSLIFNRFYVGYRASLYTQPLLFHQGWEGVASIRKDLIRYIKKGWIHREFLWYTLELQAVFGNGVFFEKKDKPFIDGKNTNILIKQSVYYSMLGQLSLYNDSLKQQVLVPVTPKKTVQEINALRRAVFLGPLDIYRKSSGKLYPDVNEFKEIFNL